MCRKIYGIAYVIENMEKQNLYENYRIWRVLDHSKSLIPRDWRMFAFLKLAIWAGEMWKSEPARLASNFSSGFAWSRWISAGRRLFFNDRLARAGISSHLVAIVHYDFASFLSGSLSLMMWVAAYVTTDQRSATSGCAKSERADASFLQFAHKESLFSQLNSRRVDVLVKLAQCMHLSSLIIQRRCKRTIRFPIKWMAVPATG